MRRTVRCLSERRARRMEVVAHAASQRLDEPGGTSEQRADRRVVERVTAGIDQRLEVGQQLGRDRLPVRNPLRTFLTARFLQPKLLTSRSNSSLPPNIRRL